MATRWERLKDLHNKVKNGKATEPEKRQYRILLREEASAIKVYRSYKKLPKVKRQ